MSGSASSGRCRSARCSAASARRTTTTPRRGAASDAPGSGILIRSATPVLLVGAGPVDPDDIRALHPAAPHVVAADGGAATLLAAGVVPDDVVGDFDSLTAADARLWTARLHRIDEQESTDFAKCLSRIAAPLIVALGVTGGRIDHELAAWSALVRHPPGGCLVVGAEDVVIHAPRALALDLPEGTRLSLFPMAPVTGRSGGLAWPIDGLRFAPDGRVGTSNRVTGPVRLAFDGPGMLLITPRAALPAVWVALAPGAPPPTASVRAG